MSRILLDTSAYSAFMKGDPEIRSTLQVAEEIFLNPVVLGELFSGFTRGKREKKNLEELGAFLSSPRVEILEIDEETAPPYAVIYNTLRDAGTPIPTNDIWIAATAMQHGLRVLTRDTHFRKVPQIILMGC